MYLGSMLVLSCVLNVLTKIVPWENRGQQIKSCFICCCSLSFLAVAPNFADEQSTEVERASTGVAFPGACGYGAHQRDWSDASIVRVSNLNDSGPGSLRQALTTTGKRVVVFDVAGTIKLASMILVESRHSDLYVAGQTAPGDGIQVIGPPVQQHSGSVIRFRGDRDGTVDNVILRFLSWRGFKAHVEDYGIDGDVMAVQGTTNFILDHNSLAFSRDEVLGINSLSCRYPQFGNGVQNNLSFTNNLVAEPFEPHATIALFASGLVRKDELGTCDDVTPYAHGKPDGHPYPPYEGARDPWPSSKDYHRLTIHRNVFSSGTHRAPILGTRDTSVTNNIAYGTELGSLILQGNVEVDYVGNMALVHREVVESPIYQEFLYQTGSSVGGNPFDMENEKNWFDLPGSVYIDGHYLETSPFSGSIVDPWQIDKHGVPVYWEVRTGSESDITRAPDIFASNWLCDGSDWRCILNARRDKPLHHPSGRESVAHACSVQIVPDTKMLADVLDVAGNSKGIDCSGDWYYRRQPTDVRQIKNVRNRTDSIGGARPIGKHDGVQYPQLASISPRAIDEIGGYDSLSGGSACVDSDGDGLPDAFEQRHGLNQKAKDALADRDGDGFTNIEEWFNGTRP